MGDGGLLGWATEPLIRSDDAQPGTLARVLTAAPARRQSIFAALAKITVEGNCRADDLFSNDLAYIIRHGRAADILRHAFTDVPRGLLGLLERVGEKPLPRAKDYIALHALAQSDDVRGADALRGSGRITCRKLEVLAALDPRWRHANTLERIDTGVEAMRFNAAIEFVQSVNSKATDEVVAGAIARMSRSSSLPKLLDRFMRRADRLPPHPISEGDNELRPLATMRDLLEAGRKYRNCLAHRLADIAAGKMAIAEFRGEILLEFRPLSMGRGWMLWSAHGPRNELVALDLKDEAAAACERHGVPHVAERPGNKEWQSYRRFVRELEWG